MKKGTWLNIAWPVLIGVSVGVELILSSLIVFGPVRVRPELLVELTERGQVLFKPERDTAIYILGCAFTVCLIGALRWMQVCASVTDAKSLAKRQWSQLAFCIALFLIHLFGLLIVQRLFMSGEGQIPRMMAAVHIDAVAIHRVLSGEGHLPMMMVAALFVPPLLSLCVVFFGWRWPQLECPEPSSAEKGCPLQGAALHRWLDVAIPLLVIAVIYIPRYRELAGTFFQLEKFHHWDLFAMGPTLAFHHGIALGTDFYTQYGFLWPLIYNSLSWLLPISYGGMIHLSVIYGGIYFVVVYVLVCRLLQSRIWAAAGVIFTLTLQLFSGLDLGQVLWQYPSSTILRSPLDVWFFLCILMYARSARCFWLRLAAGICGAAILFETDTGIYLSATFVACIIYFQSLPRTTKNSIRHQIPLILQCVAVALLVLLSGLWIAGRGTLLQKAFWTGWFESLITYGAGLSMLPVASVPISSILLFALVLILYLSTIGVALVKLPARNNSPEGVVLACLSTYGLATLLLFIGRSHPFNIFHVSVPFCIVAVATLAHWNSSWEQPETLSQKCATRKIEQPLEHLLPWRRLLPWGALVATTMLMLTNRHFQEYPGILQSFFSAPQPAGFCLLKESGDVCGLPAEAQGDAAIFNAIVGRLEEAIASGKTVAVLDDSDTIFYLAVDAAPWSRYSPTFPQLITRASVAQLVRQISERGPHVVVIRNNPANAQRHNEADVWHAVHETVANHYRLDSTVGIFEFWRRNQT
ncbi:MAG: hypothetical protein NTY01_07565 [Verrucomicrobia bacterium]|nr:hypothetical protein [Verrucomicrobiota bacterium]